MKGKILLCGAALWLSTVSFAASDVTVRSGDILSFGQKGTAVVKFDYSSTEVNDFALKDYIKEEGGVEYEESWNIWIREAEKMFVTEFNKQTAGVTVTRKDDTAATFGIAVKVKAINTGSTPKSFLPSAISWKKLGVDNGSPELNGTVTLTDSVGNTLCVLTLKNIYGTSAPNTSARLLTLYTAVAKKITKAVGKAVKEKAKADAAAAKAQAEEEEEEDEEYDEEEEDEEYEDDEEDDSDEEEDDSDEEESDDDEEEEEKDSGKEGDKEENDNEDDDE